VPWVIWAQPDDAGVWLANWEAKMDRAELKAQIDELMRQYDAGEIDRETYSQKMMELTTSAQE
jgi:hypothetical protein